MFVKECDGDEPKQEVEEQYQSFIKECQAIFFRPIISSINSEGHLKII